MYVDVKEVSVTYSVKGEQFTALDNVNLEIEQGEFICLLGPSGCGKSTLLNCMAGFLHPAKGEITINGSKVTAPSASYVTIFQNYGLLPWRSVEKNVELGLEGKGISKKERKEKADHFLELVGLSEAKNKLPAMLSGGMKQRVAIARALAVDPEILFMDEPLGALDAITRIKLQEDILNIAKQEKKTVIFVTHDIEEAVFLANRIVVMTPNPGKVKTILTPKLGDYRDRTSDEFLLARDKVFQAFELKKTPQLEYYI